MMKRPILIMESDPTLSQTLQPFMQSIGAEAHCVKSIQEIFEAFSQQEYCLVILNFQQLDKDSIHFVSLIQSEKTVPVLAITDTIKSEEKLKLFQAGIHAHIERPVDIRLCAAQANALIQLYEVKTYQKQDALVFGTALVIQHHFRQVFVHGQLLELTRKEFDLLYYLAQYPCQVFNFEQLYSHIWKDDYTFGGENTVKVHIVTLRKKLRAIKPNCIQNVWGLDTNLFPRIRKYSHKGINNKGKR